MAAYAQFGYGGYPSASQLMSSHAAQSPQTGDTPTAAAAQLTISSANAPALSPVVDCRANTAGGDVSSGALSPDALSQSSNNAGPSASSHNSVAAAGSLDGGGNAAATAAAMAHAAAASGGGSCCENGRPIMTDPVSGQTVCSCQYDSARLALSGYSRLPAGSVGVYGTPYPSTDQNPYQSIGVDNSAFYSPLSNPYGLKDSASGTEMTAWTSAGLQPTTGYYSYDPMSAYGYGASYDLASRRKNATRESTATLKAWLNEHKKNPYPTKGEKIMLAIITKMTLTQVSTWFANARRRLKKENKMTWEPKNRTDDDDDAIVSDDEKDKDELDGADKAAQTGKMHSSNAAAGILGGNAEDHRKELEKDEDDFTDEDQKLPSHLNDGRGGLSFAGGSYHSGLATVSHPHGYHPYHHQHPAYYQHQQAMLAASYHSSGSNINNNNNNKLEHSDSKNPLSRDCGVPIPATKPKIWSLADTVACKTPPPAAYMGQQQQQQQQQQLPLQHQQHQHASSNQSHHMGGMRQQHTLQMPQQSLHMMNNFGAMSYSRTPTTAYGGFPGATAQQQHTTNNTLYNNNNISNTSSNNNNNISINTNSSHNSGSHTTPITATVTTTINPLVQQLQSPLMRQPPHHHPNAASQRVAMGFPEAQPDTPPQTPPNMKVPSVALAANLLLTASQVPTTAICRSINATGYGSGGGGSCLQYGTNYVTRFGEYSPRDETSSSSSNSSCGSASPQRQQSNLTFKPMFKSQQITMTEFVSPV